MTDLHDIHDPVALARAVLAMPCSTKGEAAALGAQAHRLAVALVEASDTTERERSTFETYRSVVTSALGIEAASCAEDVQQAILEAKDEAKAADLHRNLNRRVAGALGLLKMQTDPETGEEFLPSWHDMPEKVEALKAERDAAWARERDSLSIVAGHSREICKLRRDLAAERSVPDFAGMEWMDDVKVWRRALLRLVGGRTDHLHAMFGDEIVRAAVAWGNGDSARWDNLPAPEQAHWVADYIERAAMQAADKVTSQPDLRPSNILLTLTPALLKRVEILGYAPGETPTGVLPWLVAFAEEMRQDVALAAGELLIPIPEPGSDLSRVMIANRLLKGRAEKAGRELTEAQKSLSRWESEATYLLEHTPDAIRVREGGGPENLRASLSVTWMKLLEAAKKYAEAVKSVEGVDLASVLASENPDRPGELREFNPTLAFQAIDLAKALVAERAKPRPWLINETEGSTCVSATSQETAWAAYEATIGDPIEFDDTEYHVHEVTVKDVDEMLEAALTADEELHKAKKAARVAEKDAEEKSKVLDEIRNALGDGAKEDLWPPGKTLGEAVKLLATRAGMVEALLAPAEAIDPGEVLKLDSEATPGPWDADHAWWPGEVTDEYAAVGPVHTLRKYDFLDLDTPEKRAALDVAMAGIHADEKLIAYYRTAAPTLAREVARLRLMVADYQALAAHREGEIDALRQQVTEALAALPEDTKRIDAELRAENARLQKERAALLDGFLAAPFDEAMGSDPSVRLVHELAKVGAVTVEQVLTRSPSDLLRARLPRRCLLELVRLLAARGLRLRDDDGSWK